MKTIKKVLLLAVCMLAAGAFAQQQRLPSGAPRDSGVLGPRESSGPRLLGQSRGC